MAWPAPAFIVRMKEKEVEREERLFFYDYCAFASWVDDNRSAWFDDDGFRLHNDRFRSYYDFPFRGDDYGFTRGDDFDTFVEGDNDCSAFVAPAVIDVDEVNRCGADFEADGVFAICQDDSGRGDPDAFAGGGDVVDG